MTTIAEPIIEEIANNLDEAAAVTRTLNAATMGAFTFGVGTGAVIGFFWGYRFNKKKLHADSLKHAEEEIQKATTEMAEHYRNKELALADRVKDPVEEIVREKGYSPEEYADTPREELGLKNRRPLPAPVPIFNDPTETHTWDYTRENASRNPRLPYVIHKEEFDQFDAYSDVSYAWYPLDEILADDGNEQIENIAAVVGAESLERFGHGSGDPNVVFVRNNELRLQIEVVRVPNMSYEESIQGLDADEEVPEVVNDEPDE